MLKPITVKIFKCEVMNHPAVTDSTIIKEIRNTLFNVTDVNILRKECSVVIKMWSCDEDNLRALEYLKEFLWADYISLY